MAPLTSAVLCGIVQAIGIRQKEKSLLFSALFCLFKMLQAHYMRFSGLMYSQGKFWVMPKVSTLKPTP